ncbi:hypothetical protein HDU85_007468 [Gaertneriomyces sp. JEL0708]|nr:hypothetical protein HDU85_007468 [Gaertneriomyces sp. JEL0708]
MALNLSATADWNQLHDRFYCKKEIYVMLWKDVDLANYIIAVAPYGGPVAMIRNDRRLMTLQNQSIKPVIHIYTSSGKLISQFQWDKGKIVGMGWTNTEHLMCVLDNGTIKVYDIHGEAVQFSLGQDAKEFGVLACQFWDTGLVVLTGNYKFVAVTDLDEPRPKPLAETGLNQLPHCWTLIPPKLTLSGHVEVLVAVGSTVLVVDASGSQDQLLSQGPFSRMAVSPDGKFLALFTKDGKVWVVSTDFQKSLAEFSTKSNTPPTQMAWCGDDSVVLHWPDAILVVGPFGDWIKYAYEGTVHLVSEIDGLRIISSDKCEFLHRVPSAIEDIFRIGSTAPGAILYDALDHFEKKSPRADENIRNIKPELTDAVDTCIEAAGHEFHTARQRSLLRAASFGKCFLDSYPADRFIDMCKTLRVLNAVRHFEIGIPLTYSQYNSLTPQVLIDRLVHRHQHLLALRISEYLGLSKQRILIHWACLKIKLSLDDEETLVRSIVEKLGGRDSGISYVEVAKAAFECGRISLATKLLDYEPHAANQVPLLMSMEENEVALIKAIESGDTDLVYLVLLHTQRTLPLPEFFRLLDTHPLASTLFTQHQKQMQSSLLQDYYYQNDHRSASASLLLTQSYSFSDMSARISQLQKAHKLYLSDPETAFEAKVVEDEIKLINLQRDLERESGHVFLDLTLSQTIFKMLVLGLGSKAAKVKSEFRVPDRRFWWLKIKALVQTSNWDGLEKFAKSTPKLPASHILDVLIRAGTSAAFAQAKKYVDVMVKAGGAQEKEAQAFLEILAKGPGVSASAGTRDTGSSSRRKSYLS